MRFLFLLFIIVPIIEITLLINVGEAIGVWSTIGLVLLSAFIGVNMLRYQGLTTLARAQQRANQGEIPGKEMVEGIVLAVGGALLVTPGFVTDVIGFCCLIPFTRHALANALIGRFTMVAMHQRQTAFENEVFPETDVFSDKEKDEGYQDSPFKKDKKTQGHRGDVIDGEFQRKE
ncbi:MAG: FxsA family protein [Pontibacterium sp.]